MTKEENSGDTAADGDNDRYDAFRPTSTMFIHQFGLGNGLMQPNSKVRLMGSPQTVLQHANKEKYN